MLVNIPKKLKRQFLLPRNWPRREIILQLETEAPPPGSSRSERWCRAGRFWRKLGVDYNQVKRQLENELEKLAKASPGPTHGLALSPGPQSVRCRGKRIAAISR